MKAITTFLSVLALTALTAQAAEPAAPADPSKPDARTGAAAPNASPNSESDKPKLSREENFAKKDTDGNGKLSKEEYTKNAKNAEKAENAFKARDKNGDGVLSKEEYLAPKSKKDKES